MSRRTPRRDGARRPAPRSSAHSTDARAPRGWSPRAWSWALAALYAAAFAWRVAYVLRLAGTPLGGSLTEDAAIYWGWATYLLQHGPLGSHPFFLGPLYPYVLTLLRALLGDGVQSVLLVQCAWGAASVVLLADAVRRLTSSTIGLLLGVVLAGYRMAAFFDGLVLMESLVFFLEALLLWWVSRTRWERPGPWTLFGTGALIGVIAEGRATAALLLPAAFVALAGFRPRASALRRWVLTAVGFAVVITPVAARNALVSGEWIPFTYNFGYNLYIGNNPEATGGFVLVTGTQSRSSSVAVDEGGTSLDGRAYLSATEGAALSAAASSARWTAKARAFVAEHPGRAAALALRKLGMLWNWREYPQIEHPGEYAALAGPLGWKWIGDFGPLGALALAGAWLAWRRGPAGRFALAYALAITSTTAPFFVTDRFRHHLVPAATLLAAIAVERAWRVRREPPRAVLRMGAAFALGIVIVSLPAPGLGERRYAWGLAADLGTRWLERGRADLAAGEFEKAVALVPKGGSGTASQRYERAMVFYGYAVALQRLGRLDDARPWLERAVATAPDHRAALRALADDRAAAQDLPAAELLWERLAALPGGEASALASRGWAAARAGNLDQAERLFAEAVEKDHGLEEAWGALVRVRIQRGDLPGARSTLDRAIVAGLPLPTVRVHQALLFALDHRFVEAQRALAEVPPASIAADPTIADVARQTRRVLEAAARGQIK